jgi:ABC-type branched-subunit amino acid transport system substrate-binding protein
MTYPVYSEKEGEFGKPAEGEPEHEIQKVRISAIDLIKGENLIRRVGARKALRFFESLAKFPVDDERKGFVYFRIAKIRYAIGDYQRSYESVEKAIPILKARYNLYSAMFLRMKIFAEMGWYREAKQVAGFLADSGFVGFDEREMYLFMADADVRIENPVEASVEFEKAFVLGDYESRVEIYRHATDQITALFDGISNPFIFRNALESTNTLHFRTLISYLASRRCLEEKRYGFTRYFLKKFFDISDFTGDEERGVEIEERLAEERYGKPVIAVYLPFTGPYTDFSFMVLSGLEMVLLKNSSQGGFSENPFFIEVHDTYGDASMLARHLEEGRLSRDVLAIVGPLSGREGYFLENGEGFPPIFYLGQKYLDRGRGLINFGLKPSQEAMKLVNFAFSSGVFKAAVLYPENGYGRAYRTEVLKAAGMQGIDIVVDKSYPPETEDFVWLIKDIVREKNFEEYGRVEEKDVSMPVDFDGVFILDVPERGIFLHAQMVYYNVKVPYFAFSSWVNATFLKEVKGDLKDLYTITDYYPFSASQGIQEF